MDAPLKIVGLLGRGGSGRVYLAKRPDGSEVALKVLHQSADQVEVARMRDEAAILGFLDDPALISSQEPTLTPAGWALQMDHVPGRSLRWLIHEHGELPEKVALEILAELARLLDRCWSEIGPDGEPLRLVHRDIKPENVILTPTGQVKLVDFGIARADFSGRQAKTTNYVAGTDGYIAPERFVGVAGDRTDVFSLGIVLHEMLTGQKPKNVRKQDDTMLAAPALELAMAMTHMESENRPTMAEASKKARELADPVRSKSLAEWAPANVKPARFLSPDGLVGTTLSNTPPPPSSGRSLLPMYGCAALLLLGGIGLGGLGLTLIGAAMAFR